MIENVLIRWFASGGAKVLTTSNKQAARRDEILDGLDKDLVKRAGKVNASLKRSMPGKGIWLFDASSGGDTYTVSLKAEPPTARTTKVTSSDLYLRCTCPFWQYGGPEYHAKRGKYLYKTPQGTAGTPDVRDPDKNNYVCKHAYAVLQKIDKYRLRK